MNRPNGLAGACLDENLPSGLLGLVPIVAAPLAVGYPLDGYEATGISRLLHQRWVREGKLEGKKRPSGELMPLEMVRLKMMESSQFELPASDAELAGAVKGLLGQYVNRYGIALLDLSDPDHPRHAEWNDTLRQNVGSVGKLSLH